MATLLGKEAAMFIPSGSMGNLIACTEWFEFRYTNAAIFLSNTLRLAGLVHCNVRGSEAIVGDHCHIFRYEQGSLSQVK